MPLVISPGLSNSFETAKKPNNGNIILWYLHKAVLLMLGPPEQECAWALKPRLLNSFASWNVNTSQLTIKSIVFK